MKSEGSTSNHPKAIVGPLDNPVGQALLDVGEHALLMNLQANWELWYALQEEKKIGRAS